MLDGLGATYTVVELNEADGGYALRAELANKVGRTSVPALFVGGEFVGGCNDGARISCHRQHPLPSRPGIQ